MTDAAFHYELTVNEGALSYALSSDDAVFMQSLLRKWSPRFLAQRLDMLPKLVTPLPQASVPIPAAASPPAFQENREDLLLQQIKHLQSQIDSLSQQALQPFSHLADRPEPPSPIIPLVQAALSEPPVVLPFSQAVLFEPTLPDEAPEPAMEFSFEHAVDNLDISVENVLPTDLPQASQSIAPEASTQPVWPETPPVENLAFSSITPATPLAESNDDDLDKLLDTVMADMEADEEPPETEESALSLEETNEGLLSPPFTMEIAEVETPEIFPSESLVVDPPDLFAFSGEEPPENLLENEAEDPFEAGLADLASPPQPTEPQPVPPVEKPQFHFDPMQAMTEISPRALKGPVYAPPKIDFDFGLPAMEPVYNMDLRSLSLESLQTPEQLKQAAEMESTFPDEADLNASGPLFSSFSAKVSRFKMGAPPPKPESSNPEQVAQLEKLDIETLQELCDMAPYANTGNDFLLLAAYFMDQVKETPVYTLKEINSQLVRSGMTPVHHGILEEIINNHYLSVEQDLTGTAHAAEYRLTPTGYSRIQELMQQPVEENADQDPEDEDDYVEDLEETDDTP